MSKISELYAIVGFKNVARINNANNPTEYFQALRDWIVTSKSSRSERQWAAIYLHQMIPNLCKVTNRHEWHSQAEDFFYQGDKRAVVPDADWFTALKSMDPPRTSLCSATYHSSMNRFAACAAAANAFDSLSNEKQDRILKEGADKKLENLYRELDGYNLTRDKYRSIIDAIVEELAPLPKIVGHEGWKEIQRMDLMPWVDFNCKSSYWYPPSTNVSSAIAGYHTLPSEYWYDAVKTLLVGYSYTQWRLHFKCVSSALRMAVEAYSKLPLETRDLITSLPSVRPSQPVQRLENLQPPVAELPPTISPNGSQPIADATTIANVIVLLHKVIERNAIRFSTKEFRDLQLVCWALLSDNPPPLGVPPYTVFARLTEVPVPTTKDMTYFVSMDPDRWPAVACIAFVTDKKLQSEVRAKRDSKRDTETIYWHLDEVPMTIRKLKIESAVISDYRP